MTVLQFPYTPHKHLAQINYEQAHEHYNEIIRRFNVFDQSKEFWFQQAADRCMRATYLMMEVA